MDNHRVTVSFLFPTNALTYVSLGKSKALKNDVTDNKKVDPFFFEVLILLLGYL